MSYEVWRKLYDTGLRGDELVQAGAVELNQSLLKVVAGYKDFLRRQGVLLTNEEKRAKLEEIVNNNTRDGAVNVTLSSKQLAQVLNITITSARNAVRKYCKETGIRYPTQRAYFTDKQLAQYRAFINDLAEQGYEPAERYLALGEQFNLNAIQLIALKRKLKKGKQ